jgi:tetratricopeptide (TPR) repeat protein
MYAYDNIGSVYTELGDYPKAIEWQTKSLNMALEVKGLDNIKYAYELLANTYAKKGDYKLAYENYLLFTKYKDSLLNESTSKQLAEMDKKFESAQKDKAIILKDAEILKQSTIAEKQATQRNYLLLGIALLLLFSVYIYRGYKQKQKANEIIALQKEEVEMQKTLVEEKQKEILDSIHYAKRIQESLLPTEKYIERVLKKK